ncbi:YcxB family protein [Sphingorhabdus arenilitoris]|uniref:YcxB family protein n=1 Tax=Sphingorhabdus arenilitoris TaxID=1490041 RepID=A0ABV8RH15_9SPHN
MSGSVTISASEEQVLAAYQLHWSVIPRKGKIIFGLLVMIIASIMAYIVSDEGPLMMLAAFAGYVLFGVLVLFFFRWINKIWWVPRFVKRVYAQQADLRKEFTISWDQDGFRILTENGDMWMKWTELHGWRRTERTLLLYRSEVLFNFVPLRADQDSALLDDMQAHLVASGVEEK